MILVRILIYIFIFLSSTAIGILISKKYTNRVLELKEFKNALNIFKSKIKFTYETIPEIFNEISKEVMPNVGSVFQSSSNNMDKLSAQESWNLALNLNILNITEEDIFALNKLGNLLGNTDIDGQISQIDLTQEYLQNQIEKAEKQCQKNQKLYQTLGMITGLAIVIILM